MDTRAGKELLRGGVPQQGVRIIDDRAVGQGQAVQVDQGVVIARRLFPAKKKILADNPVVDEGHDGILPFADAQRVDRRTLQVARTVGRRRAADHRGDSLRLLQEPVELDVLRQAGGKGGVEDEIGPAAGRDSQRLGELRVPTYCTSMPCRFMQAAIE